MHSAITGFQVSPTCIMHILKHVSASLQNKCAISDAVILQANLGKNKGMLLFYGDACKLFSKIKTRIRPG
jgi:hypothetical protein